VASALSLVALIANTRLDDILRLLACAELDNIDTASRFLKRSMSARCEHLKNSVRLE
jgi:hypothetical protein